MFRIEVTLGIAPDFIFNPQIGQYKAPSWFDYSYQPVVVYTPWHSSLDESKRDGAAKVLLVQSGYADGNADSGKIDNGPAIESVRLPKEKKQRTSRKELSSGKAHGSQAMMSVPILPDDAVQPKVSMPASSPGATSMESVPPKKQRTSRLVPRMAEAEIAPIYKEREEAYPSQYGYFSTMTLAINTRVVYVTT